ncbi:MAG TPA: 6-phosphogluconolactonase [Solirubrobacteraceae bacterium]|nr:6-phosphogluconolactonase [Solirubrobacteraceae bacterium]
MTHLTACPDADTVARRAAAHIARALARAREQRGVAHLALSGGTTPGRTYELLAAQPEALAGVEVWFADERCVAPQDEQSNYLLVAETLLAGGAVAPERVHRMHGEAGPREGARLYVEELARVLPSGGGDSAATVGLPVLDVIVLGIGPDGHVASLFPGAATLDAGEQAVCLGVSDSPKPPPQRITLSLAVLRAARECVLLATGASKADAVTAMFAQPSRHVPASLLRRERLTVIVDDAAAPAARRP